MRFSFKSFLAFGCLLAPFSYAEDTCNSWEEPGGAPFAKGRVGGQAFPDPADYQMTCNCRWKGGDQIVGIEAWAAKFQLKAIKFKFANSGWTELHGQLPDDKTTVGHQVATWNPNDEVAVHITNNKPDDHKPMDGIGRVRVTRGGEEIFNVGCDKKKMQPAELPDIDQGAGIILGAKVRSGAWVSSLEFKMLKSKIISTELTDIKLKENLDDWNKQKKGIKNIALDEVYFVNPNDKGGPNLTYTFAKTVSKEQSKKIADTWQHSVKFGLSVTVGGKVGVPLVAEGSVSVTGSFEYQYQWSKTTETSTSDKVDLSYSLSSPLNSPLMPQRAAHCTAWAITGEFSSDYEGTVTHTLQDGTKFATYSTGNVQSIGWVKGRTECKDIPLKDVPNGVTVQKGKTRSKRDEVIADGSKRAIAFQG